MYLKCTNTPKTVLQHSTHVNVLKNLNVSLCKTSCGTYIITAERRIQLLLMTTTAITMMMMFFIAQVRALADKYGLKVHMDGARVMNAAVALGVPPSTILQHAHTVSVCLSKVRLQFTIWTSTCELSFQKKPLWSLSLY